MATEDLDAHHYCTAPHLDKISDGVSRWRGHFWQRIAKLHNYHTRKASWMSASVASITTFNWTDKCLSHTLTCQRYRQPIQLFGFVKAPGCAHQDAIGEPATLSRFLRFLSMAIKVQASPWHHNAAYKLYRVRSVEASSHQLPIPAQARCMGCSERIRFPLSFATIAATRTPPCAYD